ncbi:MAG: hypothetical protein C1942_03920 [Prosthecochloris sp.]|uniref:hypothetical protein n=1 Tax=Prosthecochloris sp. TaxID=290513 RepID=UPI0013CA709E|nr:hypothetical protein [Prosthecochloris sp.]NEX11834.1 hypothetical protein [Prosthecochloris sp.]
MNMTLKSWATPIVSGSIFISVLSGLMLFFHVDPGLVKLLHEWIGWVVVAGVVLHVAVHLKSMLFYLKHLPGVGIIGLSVLVFILSLYPWVEKSGNPMKKAVRMLERAPLSEVLDIAGTSREDLAARFAAAGFVASDEDASIKEIAAQNGVDEQKIMQIVFR